MNKQHLFKHTAIIALCGGLLLSPISLSAQTASDNVQTSPGVTNYEDEDTDYGWIGLLGLIGLAGLLRRGHDHTHETTRTDERR